MKEKKEYRTVWRFFTIADYEREECWLNDKAAAGWLFFRRNGFRYRFRRGTPDVFRYRVDFVERMADDRVSEAYFNFLTECGSRVVYEDNRRIYLQRAVADGPFEGDDDYARLRRANKAYDFAVSMFCRMSRIFTVIVSLGLLCWGLFPAIDVLRDYTLGAAFGALVALAAIWVPVVQRLRRRVNRLVDEVGVRR